MTEKVRKLYIGGRENKRFLDEIFSADNDKKPGLCADDIDKVFFAAVYYGWLVGNYGNLWRKNI